MSGPCDEGDVNREVVLAKDEQRMKDGLSADDIVYGVRMTSSRHHLRRGERRMEKTREERRKKMILPVNKGEFSRE